MNYSEAVDYLAGLVDNERVPPLARDLTLEPIRQLLSRLGNPQDSLQIIHVTGTKGKGSVSAMIERILRAAGYRTGLYTSPDLLGFEERVRVDGQPLTAEELEGLVNHIRSVCPTLRDGLAPTRFDVATALAFQHFAARRVDYAVIEVGMGGRTDSTNACQPVVSVITNVSLDHTRQLGNTVEAIAAEKAGIIKPGRPAITGATGGALEVIRAAAQQAGSPLRVLHEDFNVTHRSIVGDAAESGSYATVTTRRRRWPEMPLALLGAHQAANAGIAVATIEQLCELGATISDTAVAEGLRNVDFPARIEVVGRKPLVILDCAHNVASAQALVETLVQVFPRSFGETRTGQRRLIFGCSWDKDLAGVLAILAPHFDQICLTQYARSARCASLDDLRAALATLAPTTVPLMTAPATAAWQAIRGSASPEDCICVTGSVFLAGELRAEILKHAPAGS